MGRAFITVLMLSVTLSVPDLSRADRVVPSERVKSGVSIREGASLESRRIGGLRPGDEVPWVESVPGWHRVKLESGRLGFVSASWTEVIAEPSNDVELEGPFRVVTRPARMDPFAAVARFFKHDLMGLLRTVPRIELDVQEPQPGLAVRQHYDPSLPVSGFATALGGDGHYDIVLAIDTSASTAEFAETDADGDGIGEDVWKGRDSIFQAQLHASWNFVRALGRLPGNHREARRIRVGVVTFAGDERYHLHPRDEDFELTPLTLVNLAHRDAVLQIPLTDDYAVVEAELERLAELQPSGQTDFAAGIGRALIEFMGAEAMGARSKPRPEAERVIHFMTDGKPRLPYDRKEAERAAWHAAQLADELDVRINAFALGYNVVTRKVHDSLRRITEETGGKLVELESPGNIVPILGTTSFAFVDRVKLVNTTTRRESEFISTGIDGSFYGEIPLENGTNRIEVVAVTHDDRRTRQRFEVDYEPVPRSELLAEQLRETRQENAELIEQIKDRLALAMERERTRQERTLELRVESASVQ